jgi:hypothetical protein
MTTTGACILTVWASKHYNTEEGRAWRGVVGAWGIFVVVPCSSSYTHTHTHRATYRLLFRAPNGPSASAATMIPGASASSAPMASHVISGRPSLQDCPNAVMHRAWRDRPDETPGGRPLANAVPCRSRAGPSILGSLHSATARQPATQCRLTGLSALLTRPLWCPPDHLSFPHFCRAHTSRVLLSPSTFS